MKGGRTWGGVALLVLGLAAGFAMGRVSQPETVANVAVSSGIKAAGDVVSSALLRNCENQARETDLALIEAHSELAAREAQSALLRKANEDRAAVEHLLRKENETLRERNHAAHQALDRIVAVGVTADCPLGDGAPIRAVLDRMRDGPPADD